MERLPTFLGAILSCFIASAALLRAADAGTIPVEELKPGQLGEVWTVFQGSEPEAFSVEVTGVLRNALGPGKALILCRLTDPKVQNMGAVAGMSGSPLYIEGRLAGALSYQVQRFETVRYAGFTPAKDIWEVKERASEPPNRHFVSVPDLVEIPAGEARSPMHAIRPVFAMGGLSPLVAEIFAPRFAALGIAASALGGSTQSGGSAPELTEARAHLQSPRPGNAMAPLRPGGAISVALATGDITLAATGTVARVDGDHITAFGHPLLTLGDVALPMCAAEIVTILPSNMSSVKIANTGAVIGTISQDRLSAVSGTLGAGPRMIPVEVTVKNYRGTSRVLRFAVARQQQLTPTVVAAGVTQSIVGSNEAGFANGFRLTGDIRFSEAQQLQFQTLYPGPQGFTQGLNEFVQSLVGNLQNPYAKTFPEQVAFTVEPLEENPAVVLELFQLSRTTARSGQVIQANVGWRDWQGAARRATFDLAIDPAWAGKQLEVILAPGRVLDELTGRPRVISAAELRSFDAYLAAMRDDRQRDGVYLAVVEKTALFSDQTIATPDAPGSIERIARTADEARFQKREAVLPLWERHLLPGKLCNAIVRRPLQVVD